MAEGFKLWHPSVQRKPSPDGRSPQAVEAAEPAQLGWILFDADAARGVLVRLGERQCGRVKDEAREAMESLQASEDSMRHELKGNKWSW